MNFKFFIIAILIASGLVGTVFAQSSVIEKIEFTQDEIDAMKNKAVLFTLNSGTILIELYPDDAPNTVHNFLQLAESGYYDGIVFHRIIPGFMIQAGDPNTKDPESDRGLWGSGGPGYTIGEEFNMLKHEKGIVSMARQTHPDSAGSQFFIMHGNAPELDGQYTAFGKLVSGLGNSYGTLDNVAELETDKRDAPLDVTEATILQTSVLDPYTPAFFNEPDRNISYVKMLNTPSGSVKAYQNDLYDVFFHLPYRWDLTETSQDKLNILIQPGAYEHNALQQIEKSNFVPKIIVSADTRSDWEKENDKLNTGFFSIQGGDEPNILSNYIFDNADGMKAHIMVTTHNIQEDDETHQIKIIQIHFNNLETNYTIIYVNVAEWFRYEINAFQEVVKHFEIVVDEVRQPLGFTQSPVFKQVINDAKEAPDPESLPPVRVGGCLIATAAYGSELAPQVQLLREVRDNMVLQTQSGASFMNGFNQLYYSFSPTIADYERESPIFKEAVKLVLTPLLASLTLLQYTDIDSEHEMLGYGIGLILLNIGMYFVAPAVLITKIRSFYKLQ